jgi:hypothetical protein
MVSNRTLTCHQEPMARELLEQLARTWHLRRTAPLSLSARCFLSAVSLHRVGFGLLLVVAFSLGLASTLTGIGLVFVYIGRLMKRPLPFNRFSAYCRLPARWRSPVSVQCSVTGQSEERQVCSKESHTRILLLPSTAIKHQG